MAVLPKSLLSFLYNVTYDQDIKDQFHADPDKFMANKFGLSKEVRDVMRQLGNVANQGALNSPQKQQLLDQLIGFIKAELSTVAAPTFW